MKEYTYTVDEIEKVLKESLLLRLLDDPTLPVYHKIEVQKELEQFSSDDEDKKVIQIESRVQFDFRLSKVFLEIDAILPKTYSYALSPKVEKTVLQISNDLSELGNLTGKFRTSLSLRAISALRSLRKTEEEYYDSKLDLTRQQIRKWRNGESIVKKLLGKVKKKKRSIEEVYTSISKIVKENVLTLDNDDEKMQQLEELTTKTNHKMESLLNAIDQYNTDVSILKGKWLKMLPLAEEEVQSDALEDVDKYLVDDLFQRLSDKKPATVNSYLKVFKAQVELQEKEAQRWALLAQLSPFFTEDSEEGKLLGKILQTLKK